MGEGNLRIELQRAAERRERLDEASARKSDGALRAESARVERVEQDGALGRGLRFARAARTGAVECIEHGNVRVAVTELICLLVGRPGTTNVEPTGEDCVAKCQMT